MNIVEILAGGIGSRAKATIPKQFLEVNEIPVIVYTLQKFQQSPLIDAICVVSHPMWKNKIWDYKDTYRLTKIRWVVEGGQTGLESVWNGLDAMKGCQEKDLILIHDSVRPFITQQDIEDNIKVASNYGVAVTSVPCVETLVKVENGVEASLQIQRDGLMRVMTPQTFRFGILLKLFRDADYLSSPYPSTFALYMSKGNPIYCSHGSERNIKITYPEDIEYFKKLFE